MIQAQLNDIAFNTSRMVVSARKIHIHPIAGFFDQTAHSPVLGFHNNRIPQDHVRVGHIGNRSISLHTKFLHNICGLRVFRFSHQAYRSLCCEKYRVWPRQHGIICLVVHSFSFHDVGSGCYPFHSFTTLYRFLPSVMSLYSIASTGQFCIHDMQWAHPFSFHTGFPPCISMMLSGHSLAHFPQETQLPFTQKSFVIWLK